MHYRFDEHGVGYKIGRALRAWRPQYLIICSWIPKHTTVLDVGCGDGVLGEKLIRTKRCTVFGIDRDPVAAKEAQRRKLHARIGNMDDGLPYRAGMFDLVICSDALQYSEKPNFVVSELLRVSAGPVILEFPNFGFWMYRIQTLFGKFPSLSLYGHTWWQTRQTRFFSLADFLSLPALKRAHVTRFVCIDWKNRDQSILARLNPNLFGRSCLLELRTHRSMSSGQIATSHRLRKAAELQAR